MALFDELIRDIGSRFNLGGKAGQLIEEMLRLMTTQPGGIGGFIDRFKSMGLAPEALSWLGNPQAPAMAGQQAERVLGSTTIGTIANRLGLGSNVISVALGYALPKVIGLLTPGGVIPTGIPAAVTSFLGTRAASYQERVEAVPPRRVEIRGAQRELPRWLIPAAAALAILGFLGYFLSGREHQATPTTPAVTQNVPPAPTIPARLALENDNGTINYSGTVGNETARSSTNDAFRAVFGANNVKGDMKVDANAGPALWLPNLKQALENFKTSGAQAMFEGSAVKIGGLIPEGERSKIMASLQSLFGSGIALGTLANTATSQVAAALSGLKPGFNARDLVAVLNQSTINFATGSAEIPAESKQMLQQAAASIKQLPANTLVQISGFTDPSGDPAANLTLSQQRAESVRQALIDSGVAPAMLTA